MAPTVRRLAGWGLVFAIAVLLTPRVFPLDDTYIALHSADVLITGVDPIFHQPALVGVTSPAYVAILVLLQLAGLAGLTAVRIASALGTTIVITGLWQVGRTLPLERRSLLVVATLTGGYVWWQLTNGLETGWAIGLLIWLIVCVENGSLKTGAVLAGLLPFFRPDIAPAAVLLLLALLAGQSWRDRAIAIGIAACVALPWLLWMHQSTGSWLPNTIEAKRLFFVDCSPLSARVLRAGSAVLIALLVLLPLAVGALELPRSPIGRFGLAAAVISLAAFTIAQSHALVHNYSRYVYAIVVPWLVWGGARFLQRATGPVFAVALGLTLGLAPFRTYRSAAQASEYLAVGAAVDAIVPENETVLVHDAGAISVFAHRRAVDLVGLKTPDSIAAQAKWTWATCGANRADAILAIYRASGAKFLVTIADWEPAIVDGLRARGVTVTPVRLPPEPDGYTIWRLGS